MHKQNKQAGFTLIELLAAAAIIGVLVTLAMPRYKAFVARSRQAEASSNLGTLHKLQEAHYLREAALDTGKYKGDLKYGKGQCGATATAEQNEVGFRLTDCAKARYLYETTSATTNTATATADGATGLKIYPDCTETDLWNLLHTGDLTNDDIVAKCKQ